MVHLTSSLGDACVIGAFVRWRTPKQNVSTNARRLEEFAFRSAILSPATLSSCVSPSKQAGYARFQVCSLQSLCFLFSCFICCALEDVAR